MFTLKFKCNKEFTSATISAVRYDLKSFYPQDGNGQPSAAAITVYPRMTSDEGGVVFNVGGDHPLAYEVAYIENQAGKTIDRIGPFGEAGR